MKPQPGHWLGRPILDQAHVHDLERQAAVHEFSANLPRHEAEAKAYDQYVQEQSKSAMAHHLMGIKAAQATGQLEEAQKHAALYELHAKKAGVDPHGPVPPDVAARKQGPEDAKLYRFRPHPGDQFAMPQPTEGAPMAKSERTTCEWDPAPTTKKRCRNPQSRLVGQKRLCHHHADLAAKDAHSAARMETPTELVKSAPMIPGRHQQPWKSADGLTIPRAGTPERAKWDAAFERGINQHFGHGEAIMIDINDTIPRNPAVNHARLELYQKMAEKERALPPVVVEPYARGWYMLDGNHRIEAYRRAGITQIPARNIKPGQAPFEFEKSEGERLATLLKSKP